MLLAHRSTESRVVEATYLGVLLIQLAKGSSVDVGQYSAHSAHVTRPSSTASCSSSMRDSFAPISSSKAGCHSLGASTTPSIELNSPAVTLRTISPFLMIGTICYGWLVLRGSRPPRRADRKPRPTLRGSPSPRARSWSRP